MEIKKYLHRIGSEFKKEQTLSYLTTLQKAHLSAVPFENLNIYHKIPLDLSLEALYQKIVIDKRGGFCFELNFLFAWLLRELGYSVTLLSAQVFNKDGTVGREHDHLTLLVNLDRKYLVDVGFGDSFVAPLPINSNNIDSQGYTIIKKDESYILQHCTNNETNPQTIFTIEPRDISIFYDSCHYHQQNKKSHFTQGRVCTKLTSTGRVTLSKNKIIKTIQSKKEESIFTENEYPELLWNLFGIDYKYYKIKDEQ